jgi:hypothetical protein
MATSQNGYPALASTSSRLRTIKIPARNGAVYLRMRGGAVGFLLAYLALWFSEKLEDLTAQGVKDDWAYAYRPVRSSTDLSNHASGTAIDLNATWHPLGMVLTGIFRRRAARDLLNDFLAHKLRGCIRWGGNYNGRKDEMHFEIVQNIVICERVAKRLMLTPRGQRILKANPGLKKEILS